MTEGGGTAYRQEDVRWQGLVLLVVCPLLILESLALGGAYVAGHSDATSLARVFGVISAALALLLLLVWFRKLGHLWWLGWVFIALSAVLLVLNLVSYLDTGRNKDRLERYSRVAQVQNCAGPRPGYFPYRDEGP